MTKRKKILVYDGSCRVCTAAQGAVAKRDVHTQFDFVDMHSSQGKRLQEQHGIDAHKTAFVIEGEDVHVRSDMALYVLEQLGWFEKIVARAGRLVPKKAADAIYSFLAKHRTTFFS